MNPSGERPFAFFQWLIGMFNGNAEIRPLFREFANWMKGLVYIFGQWPLASIVFIVLIAAVFFISRSIIQSVAVAILFLVLLPMIPGTAWRLQEQTVAAILMLVIGLIVTAGVLQRLRLLKLQNAAPR